MNETRSIWAVVADNREEAELLKLRSNLIIKISDHIKSLNVNLIEVSMLYNIKEKHLNNLMSEKLHAFSLTKLIRIMLQLGMVVKIETYYA